jgi:cytochrome P450
MTSAEATAEGAPVPLPTVRNHPFDPPPALGTLRGERQLCRLRYPDGHVGWLVTSHALARAVLADPRLSVRPDRPPVGEPGENAAVREALEDLPENAGIVITLDPPAHTRLRRLQAGYFTVRRVSEHRAAIERIVSDCLDAMQKAGPPVNLVDVFALPVPSLTICEMLGVPRSDRYRFERPTEVSVDPHASAQEKIAAFREFCDYAHGVIEQKRIQPRDDLLSHLVADGQLTDDELAGAALQLFGAGHETTANMLALGTFALLCDRSRWETLQANPSLMDTAVEELLRYLTIVQLGAFTRTAVEDIELDGVKIEAGESVTVSLPAANRDPAKFSDPDELDLTRDASGHVAFGHGRHMCLGQHLARLEMQVALAGLMRRFPALHLAVPAHEVPMYSGERALYGVRELPVAW